jgi:flagellar biogenesis protein FliO
LGGGIGGELRGERGVSRSEGAGYLSVARRGDCAVISINSNSIVVGVGGETITIDNKVLPADVAIEGANGVDSR